MTLEQLKQAFPSVEAFPDATFTPFGQTGLVEIVSSRGLYHFEDLVEKIHNAGFKLDSVTSRRHDVIIQVERII